MLQFRQLICKNADASFFNCYRQYAQAAVNVRRKGKSLETKKATIRRDGIPIIQCKKGLYNFYKGDTFSPKTLLASHGWKSRHSKGDHFSIYPQENEDGEENKSHECQKFKDLALNPTLCENLEALDMHELLEIQKLGIPKILQGTNTVLAAETGCGKTLAYLLPMIMKVLKWKQMGERKVNTPLALIITPSRELTVQIALVLIKLSKNLKIRTKIITGGRTKKLILDPPTGHVDILICSFGVLSKLSTFGVYKLQSVRFVVLDEADSLFHYTFEEKLKVFLKRLSIGYFQEQTENELPISAQLVLASATFPSRMKEVLHEIVNVSSLEPVSTEKLHRILVPQKFIRLIPSEKPAELLKYVKPKVLNRQRVIIFSNRNSTSYWLSKFLNECGIKATNLNSDMPLSERRGKYGEFLNGRTMVLSTTNGGSRGLDTVAVNHILNYDFPLDTVDYIHRCGRTGRVGTSGESKVTNFVSKVSEVMVVQKIERAARRMRPVPIFNITESDSKEELDESYNKYPETIIEDLNNPNDIPY